MAETSKIEWTQATWNPFIGCTKVSPGCDHCYAEALDNRWGRNFEILRRTSDATFYAPLHWKKPRLIFTCSLSDFFHRQADPWREEAWEIIKATPWHTYQILTKRPGLMVAWAENHRWPDNVWAGVSVESQKYVPRLTVLNRVPAKVWFVSCEPLLGYLDLEFYLKAKAINWVIVGGESGPHARPFNVQRARDIIAQCRAASIPCFIKQLGGRPVGGIHILVDRKGADWSEWPEDLRVREMPEHLGLTDGARYKNLLMMV